MKIKWRVDKWTDEKIFNQFNMSFFVFLKHCKSQPLYLLEWGGGDGFMAKNLVENSNKIVINIDPETNPLKLNPNCIRPVCGVGQKLPFRSKKFAGVHIRAALHHASLDLSDCLEEIHRVLDKDGIVFIQEPLSSNLLSRIARKLFPTEKHDPNECPFDPKHLINNVAESFDIISIKYHFITCYLFPHIVARMPFKFFWRWVAYSLFQIDKLLLSTLPVIRSRAAYIEIIGVKNDEK